MDGHSDEVFYRAIQYSTVEHSKFYHIINAEVMKMSLRELPSVLDLRVNAEGQMSPASNHLSSSS